MKCDKNGYTKTQVYNVRTSIYKHRKTKLRVYECPDCGKYHLTSNIDDL